MFDTFANSGAFSKETQKTDDFQNVCVHLVRFAHISRYELTFLCDVAEDENVVRIQHQIQILSNCNGCGEILAFLPS